MPVGAMLGATMADSGPNSAWLMDAATARRSPSTKCPYTSFVIVILACPWLPTEFVASTTTMFVPSLIGTIAITWNAPDVDHPARRASQRSAATVARGVKEDWVALFAEDAVIEDPVGPSMFDPDGVGHHGREGVSRFWDMAIAGIKSNGSLAGVCAALRSAASGLLPNTS